MSISSHQFTLAMNVADFRRSTGLARKEFYQLDKAVKSLETPLQKMQREVNLATTAYKNGAISTANYNLLVQKLARTKRESIPVIGKFFKLLHGNPLLLLAAAIGAATLALRRFTSMVRQAMTDVDRLNTLATQMNTSLTDMGGIERAAETANMGVEVLARSMMRLQRTSGQTGLSMSQNFVRVARELRDIQDPTARAIEANRLLGRSWQDVGGVLNMTQEQFDIWEESLQKQTVGDFGLVAIQEANDALKFLNFAWRDLKRAIAAEVLPQITRMIRAFTEWISEARNAQMIVRIVKDIASALKFVLVPLVRAAELLMRAWDALDKITPGFKSLVVVIGLATAAWWRFGSSATAAATSTTNVGVASIDAAKKQAINSAAIDKTTASYVAMKVAADKAAGAPNIFDRAVARAHVRQGTTPLSDRGPAYAAAALARSGATPGPRGGRYGVEMTAPAIVPDATALSGVTAGAKGFGDLTAVKITAAKKTAELTANTGKFAAVLGTAKAGAAGLKAGVVGLTKSFGLMALAAAKILPPLLAIWGAIELYKWQLKGFNDEMERARDLADQVQSRQSSIHQEQTSAISAAPEEQQLGLTADTIKSASIELEGMRVAEERVRLEAESLTPTWLSAWQWGSKMHEAVAQEAEFAAQALKKQEQHVIDLGKKEQDLIRARSAAAKTAEQNQAAAVVEARLRQEIADFGLTAQEIEIRNLKGAALSRIEGIDALHKELAAKQELAAQEAEAAQAAEAAKQQREQAQQQLQGDVQSMAQSLKEQILAARFAWDSDQIELYRLRLRGADNEQIQFLANLQRQNKAAQEAAALTTSLDSALQSLEDKYTPQLTDEQQLDQQFRASIQHMNDIERAHATHVYILRRQKIDALKQQKTDQEKAQAFIAESTPEATAVETFRDNAREIGRLRALDLLNHQQYVRALEHEREKLIAALKPPEEFELRTMSGGRATLHSRMAGNEFREQTGRFAQQGMRVGERARSAAQERNGAEDVTVRELPTISQTLTNIRTDLAQRRLQAVDL